MIIKITKEQQEFLEQHKIAMSYVFDASGLSRSEYHDQMKLYEKKVAINVTPCKNFGHTLRSRSGDCVQCRPASITFQDRYSKNGFIYIAGSRVHQILKVGLSGDIKEREYFLNRSRYGGADDWEIIYTLKCKNVGRVEYDIHKALEKFATPRMFLKGGRQVDCFEIFSCSYSTAKETIRMVIEASNKDLEWENIQKNNYEFMDTEGDGFNRKGFTGEASIDNEQHFSAGVELIAIDIPVLESTNHLTDNQILIEAAVSQLTLPSSLSESKSTEQKQSNQHFLSKNEEIKSIITELKPSERKTITTVNKKPMQQRASHIYKIFLILTVIFIMTLLIKLLWK